PLRAQDATFIPANVPHRFRNASATAPMKILWIYGRTDVTRTMTETGETQFITGEHRTPASSKG
ncbi:MAG: cupin domain-containing protein, partial [Alphaproteobacteria bacterium]|nr:cupin domain-containing protein [Alphaproteobacteria bacterium]